MWPVLVRSRQTAVRGRREYVGLGTLKLLLGDIHDQQHGKPMIVAKVSMIVTKVTMIITKVTMIVNKVAIIVTKVAMIVTKVA